MPLRSPAYDNNERSGASSATFPTQKGAERDPAGGATANTIFLRRLPDREHKPDYLDTVHRVPADVVRVYKPEEEIGNVAARDHRVARLLSHFDLPAGSFWCTGSPTSAARERCIGHRSRGLRQAWFTAQRHLLRRLVETGMIPPMSTAMWRKVYEEGAGDTV